MRVACCFSVVSTVTDIIFQTAVVQTCDLLQSEARGALLPHAAV